MKRSIPFLFLLLLMLAGCATGGGTGPAPVQEVRPEAEPAAEVREPEPVLVETALLQKETRYFRDGTVDSVTGYTYDARGNLLKGETRDSSGALLSSEAYTLKGDLPVRKDMRGESDEAAGYVLYAYDGDGRLVREEDYSYREELQMVTEYAYDPRGLKTRMSVLNGSGELLSYIQYVYRDGLNVLNELYGGDGKLQNRFEKEFDSLGNLIRDTTFLADGTVEKIQVFSYEGGFLVREEQQNRNGGLIRAYVYENDEKGSPVRIRLENNRGIVLDTVEREYAYMEKELKR